MIPSWLTIGGITFLVALLSNRLQTAAEFRWFMRQSRPRWLTFEWAIPFIWIFILFCGAWSAVLVWEVSHSGGLMAGYLLLEMVILSYTLVMCRLRSLKIGTLIGGSGFFLGCLLAVAVWPVSQNAVWLLLPYLLWSPIGTFVTWQMMGLNPSDN
ncbi:MAG: tryptophan-rich sensory protein [Thermosynechococcaceae cyanobacterium]